MKVQESKSKKVKVQNCAHVKVSLFAPSLDLKVESVKNYKMRVEIQDGQELDDNDYYND